ncbi:hypothetical protein BCF33_2625 [Hasllibacter halocynthiae]|uniref:Uncharacterized protein n=1 Tax=Hasllibacter halocynthiae TaxID=595589 RepID=A0A2T0X470_9RHOB|nr:hypothetical protein [Hasllibacter halocynthiae]PRY93741.1 hypothetical protein BCF33_2625 [Hasllibacter halocynthiae]
MADNDKMKSTNPPTGNAGKGSGPNTASNPSTTTSTTPASSTAQAGGTAAKAEAEKREADLKGEAKAAAGEVHSRAAAATDELKDEASKLSDQAKRRAEAKLHDAQEAGAERAQTLAERMRAAGEEFGEGSLPDRYVGRMADSISDAAEAFASKDPGALLADVNAFARRNPTAFLGGAALLGFAVARFAKASTPPARDSHSYGTRPDYARDTRPDYAAPAARPVTAPAVRTSEK